MSLDPVPNFNSGLQEKPSPSFYRRKIRIADIFFRARDIDMNLHRGLHRAGNISDSRKEGKMVLEPFKEQVHLLLRT